MTMEAFDELTKENDTKSKTKILTYDSLHQQTYIKDQPSEIACVIFRFRIRAINCKGNQKAMYTNLKCRLCETEEEDQDHVVNCIKVMEEGGIKIDTSMLRKSQDKWDLNQDQIETVVRRLKKFKELTRQMTNDMTKDA